MFCAATGFAGTPKVGMGKFEADRLVPVEDAKRIKVHFNADTADALPWAFVPQQKFISVLPGESSLAFYRARNTSDKDIIGIATYNVTPDRVRCPRLYYVVMGSAEGWGMLGGAIFLKSRMFLFRGTKAARGRRGRHASVVLHRPRDSRGSYVP